MRLDKGAEISADSKKTREEEARWLGGKLASIENREQVFIAASVKGRHIGQVNSDTPAVSGALFFSTSRGKRETGTCDLVMKICVHAFF